MKWKACSKIVRKVIWPAVAKKQPAQAYEETNGNNDPKVVFCRICLLKYKDSPDNEVVTDDAATNTAAGDNETQLELHRK